jgi:hypothetical protein
MLLRKDWTAAIIGKKKFIDPDWTLISRSFLFLKNDNGDIISRLELRWKNGQWTIHGLDSTIYNANHQKIYEVSVFGMEQNGIIRF